MWNAVALVLGRATQVPYLDRITILRAIGHLYVLSHAHLESTDLLRNLGLFESFADIR